MKLPAFVKTGSAALTATALQQGFSMMHFLLVLPCLKPADLATWAMYLTLTSLVDMARLGLVQSALTRLTGHHPESAPAIRTTALGMSIGVAMVGAAVLWVVSTLVSGFWNMPALPGLMAWYFPVALVTAIVRWLEGVGMARQHFRTAMVSAASYGAVFAGILIIFTKTTTNFELSWLVLLQLPALVTALAGSAWLEFRQGGLLAWPAGWWGAFWRFGRYGMLSNLGSMLMQRVDLFLLGMLVLPADLAVYNVATRLVSYLDFPLNAVGLALTPKIVQAHRQEGLPGVLRLYERSIALLLAVSVLLCVGAFLLAPMVIHLFAGDRYNGAPLLVQVLVMGSLIKPWGRVFGISLDAIGMPAANFKMLVASFFTGLVLQLTLIPVWGTFGAAIAVVATIAITTAAGHYWMRRYLPVQPLAPLTAMRDMALRLKFI